MVNARFWPNNPCHATHPYGVRSLMGSNTPCPSDLHPVSHIRLKRGCSQFLCAQVMSDLHVQALLLGLHHDEHVNPARRTPETENEH